MMLRTNWSECSGQLKGLWVALDNCRYDQATMQPIEGDVVDSDADLAELCGRMREAGRSSCAIFFCDRDVVVEPRPERTSPAPASDRVR